MSANDKNRPADSQEGINRADDVTRRIDRWYRALLARRYPGTVWQPSDEISARLSQPDDAAGQTRRRIIPEGETLGDRLTPTPGTPGKDGGIDSRDE
jgi:hypothetical protein